METRLGVGGSAGSVSVVGGRWGAWTTSTDVVPSADSRFSGISLGGRSILMHLERDHAQRS